MSDNSEHYSPLQNEKEILHRFMKILKFYNEIIKSAPLIISDEDYLNYKKKKSYYIQQEKKLEEFFRHPEVDMDKELSSHSLDYKDPGTYKLNIPENKKTRFNVYILKKINDLENDLGDFLNTLDFFYLKYKKYYDNFSFYNIFASSGLTLIESISLMFRPQVYTGVATIIISTSIALSTAILKLKNYKEKIEEIVKTTEKVYSCQAKLFTFDKLLKTSMNMSGEDSEINLEEY